MPYDCLMRYRIFIVVRAQKPTRKSAEGRIPRHRHPREDRREDVGVGVVKCGLQSINRIVSETDKGNETLKTKKNRYRDFSSDR